MIGDEVVFDREDVDVHDRGILHLRPQLFTKGLQLSIEDLSSIVEKSKAAMLIGIACVVGGRSQFLRQTAQWPSVVHPEILPSTFVYTPDRESDLFYEGRDVLNDLRVREVTKLAREVVLADVDGVESILEAVLADQIRITSGEEQRGARSETEELEDLDVQAEGLGTREGGRAPYGKVGAVAEIWAQRFQVWAQVARVQALTYFGFPCTSQQNFIRRLKNTPPLIDLVL